MHTISRDTPALYLTAVAKDRLPVFRTDAIKIVTGNALDEARKSAGFSIYAYVIMPDHLHVITDGYLKPSEILRYINGIISRRVIDHLKQGGHNSSLQKLKHETKERAYRYSLWDHHSNVFSITSEDMLMQKVNYIHQNPVRAGLVEKAEDYRWSSVRRWKGSPLEAEPLKVDIDRIAWRRGVASSYRRGWPERQSLSAHQAAQPRRADFRHLSQRQRQGLRATPQGHKIRKHSNENSNQERPCHHRHRRLPR